MKKKRFNLKCLAALTCLLMSIGALAPGAALAQPYVGEIRMFAGNFAPAGWYFCEGQLLQISENDTLFQLIGTTYGGDGESTFALPDLRGRAPIHMGAGPGLANYILGQTGGAENVTITTSQMPSHYHLPDSQSPGTTATPGPGAGPAKAILDRQEVNVYSDSTAGKTFTYVPAMGGSQPHENMQPFLTINYIISLYGIFPSPN
ncbi:MAG: tail fiber protein [Desulfotomaculaceae bacterium]|nr:tail fiber protein [Desulfotomaculaceae bacterium]